MPIRLILVSCNPANVLVCMNGSVSAMSFFPNNALNTPAFAPNPDENNNASSYPTKFAISSSSCLWISKYPPITCAAQAPVPYFFRASIPDCMVSSLCDIPK